MNNVLISFLYMETSRPVCLAEHPPIPVTQGKHIEGFQCFAQQILAFDEMVQDREGSSADSILNTLEAYV